jgi:DNA modification methylase
MMHKSQVFVLPLKDIQIHPEVLKVISLKKMDHIEYTMKRFGQQLPVLGNMVDGTFHITDGVVRYEVAKKLGMPTLKCLDSGTIDKDVIRVRMTSNQRSKISYMEMATSADYTLESIGKSQGKKRNNWLGMEKIEDDKYFGLAGKDRYELTCHLLDLPVKASSLRKLMSIYEYHQKGDTLCIMKGLDEGIYNIDSAYRLIVKDTKIKDKNDFKLKRIEEINNSKVWFEVHEQSSDNLSNLKKYRPNFAMFSPPYWMMKEYREQGEMKFGQEPTLGEYLNNCRKFIDALVEIMDKDGVVVIVIGESYNGGYKSILSKYEEMLWAAGLDVLGVCEWVKTNPVPVKVANFFRPANEKVFVCKMKGGKPVFNPRMTSTIEGSKSVKKSHKAKDGTDRYFLQDEERVITNIIETPVCDHNEYKKYDPNFSHDAPAPMALYDIFTESYTLPGMTCIDIHCGAGQGLEVFSRWGCNSIGVDIDPVSVEFCRKRMDMVLGTNQKEVLAIAA